MMDLRVVPTDDGLVTVMDRCNLDAGAIYTTAEGLSYNDAVKDATAWADRRNAQDVVDRLTRVLAGETVDGLKLGSAGITEEFCRKNLDVYQGLLNKT